MEQEEKVGLLTELPPPEFNEYDFRIEPPPDLSEWECHILPDVIFRPHKGKEPNRFHRFMHRLAFGFRWIKR